MAASNKLVLSLTENPEVKDYLATKSPGEDCVFEVTASLDEMTPDQAVFSVKSADVIKEHGEAYGEGGETSEEYSEEGGATASPTSSPAKRKPAAVLLAFKP